MIALTSPEPTTPPTHQNGTGDTAATAPSHSSTTDAHRQNGNDQIPNESDARPTSGEVEPPSLANEIHTLSAPASQEFHEPVVSVAITAKVHIEEATPTAVVNAVIEQPLGDLDAQRVAVVATTMATLSPAAQPLPSIRWPLAARLLPALLFLTAASFLSWRLRPEMPLQSTFVAATADTPSAGDPFLPQFGRPQSATPSKQSPKVANRRGGTSAVRPAPLPMPQMPSTSPMAPSALPPIAAGNRIAGLPAGAADPTAAMFAQGVAAQQAGRRDEAIKAYQEVLAVNPQAVAAHLNLALLAGQDKKLDRAVSHLQAARKIDPKNLAVAWQLGQTFLMMQKPQAALEPLRAVVQMDAKNKGARVMLAQALTALNRPREAYAAWRDLAKSDSKDAAAALAAGAIALEGLNQPKQAESWLLQAQSLAPKDPRSTMLLARALLEQKRNDEAIALLEGGVKNFEDIIEMRTLLSDARWLKGDKDGAFAALQTAIEKVPPSREKGVPHARLRVAAGRLQAMRQNWEGAVAQWRRALEILPQETAVHTMLAEALMRSGDRAGEAKILEKVLALDPKRMDVRLPLARALAETKEWDAAQRQYASYLKVRPNDARVLIESAALFEKQDKIDKALSGWSVVGKVLPDNPLPALERGRLLRKQKKEAQALQMYRLALQIAPNDPNALLACAELEEKSGQSMRALTHWRALISSRPNYEAAYAAYLSLAAAKAQLPSALNFLKQQLAKSPERPAAYNAILTTHKKLGQPAKGRAIVEQMSKQWPRARAPRSALNAFDQSSNAAPISQPTSKPVSPPAATGSKSTPSPAPTRSLSPLPTASPTKAAALPAATPDQSTLDGPKKAVDGSESGATGAGAPAPKSLPAGTSAE